MYNVYRFSFVPVASSFSVTAWRCQFRWTPFQLQGRAKELDDSERENSSSNLIAAAATRCYQIPPLGCGARCEPPTETTGRPGHGCCLARKTRVRERERSEQQSWHGETMNRYRDDIPYCTVCWYRIDIFTTLSKQVIMSTCRRSSGLNVKNNVWQIRWHILWGMFYTVAP